MELNLEEKVVIVTGAGRGIGRAIALTFAREKSRVIIDDVDLGAAKIVEEEAKALGVQAMAIGVNVTKPDEVARMIEETLGKFARLDILINNAGILYNESKPATRPLFYESRGEDWVRQLNITVYGVMNCTRAALETMMSQKKGCIINIVSDAGRTSGSRLAVYGAGNGGIIALSRHLAYELGPFGIRVNCVSPGIIGTTRAEMSKSGQLVNPEAVKFAQELETLAKGAPLGRLGSPQDVANAVVFLASDVSSYITGQTLSVNGGFIMP